MRASIAVVALSLCMACGSEEPREKADPPPRPTRTTTEDMGTDGPCTDGYRAFRYDPDRKCRYAWQTLCGLEPQTSVCLVPRKSAYENATGDCWHFETCPPIGFTPTYGACSSREDVPFCDEVTVPCEELSRAQCEARSECRAVQREAVYEEGLGCWDTTTSFLHCEPATACSLDTAEVSRIDGRCVATTACTDACEDCAPCPSLDEGGECREWSVDFAVVRIEEGRIAEQWEILTEAPAEPRCLDEPALQAGEPLFLGPEGVTAQAPAEPQVTVLFPVAEGREACQLFGGAITIAVESAGLPRRADGFFPDVADCADVYVMARVRHAPAPAEYEAKLALADGCGNDVASWDQHVTTWTHDDSTR